MNLLKPEIIYLVLVLVVPGLISQSVFNAMVARGKDRQLDLYLSITHSAVIFTCVYSIAVLIFGPTIINSNTLDTVLNSNRWAPILIALTMGVASIIWGILYSKIYRSSWLKNFLIKFGNAVEPPNVYSALLCDKYRVNPNDDERFWLTYKNGDKGYIEGCVEMASVESSPREVYLTRVAYLNANRERILELPENQGIILKIDDLEMVEVSVVNGAHDS
jgi:hypothetical protein